MTRNRFSNERYFMIGGDNVRFTFDSVYSSQGGGSMSARAKQIKLQKQGYYVRIVEGSSGWGRGNEYRVYKRKKRAKTKPKKTSLGKFLLQTRTKMDKLVTVYRSERGAFYIMRNGRKVYVHEVGWGYRDSQAHKKNKRSYQVVRIGSSRDPRWGYRRKR